MNIDINYLLKLTDTKIKDLTIISYLPTFYEEFFCYLMNVRGEQNISPLKRQFYTTTIVEQ